MKRFYPIILSFLVLVLVFYSSCSPTTPEKPNTPTIVSFSASPSTIKYKESSLLSWSVSNATSVFIDYGIGNVEPSGSREVSPTETSTYSLRATNAVGESYKTCKVTVEGQAYFELISYTKKINSYERCEIDGVIKNTGNMPGYNVMISFSAYNSNNTIIDTAFGFPADLEMIPVNVKAIFDAVFFKLNSWTKVAKLTYKITWLDGEGLMYSQEGFIF